MSADNKGSLPFLSSANADIKGSDPFMTATVKTGNDPFSSAPAFPAIGLVCSGGHTAIYRVNDWTDVALIGTTIDDAVGEAYDKVASILGLGYPGGPVIDKLAAEGDPAAVRFPRSMLGRESLDFSFSGLKTAVLYHVRGVPGKPLNAAAPERPHAARYLCFIPGRLHRHDRVKAETRGMEQNTRPESIIIGGGVWANRGFARRCRTFPCRAFFPTFECCTDNAAMSGGSRICFFEKNRTGIARSGCDHIECGSPYGSRGREFADLESTSLHGGYDKFTRSSPAFAIGANIIVLNPFVHCASIRISANNCQ